MTTTGSERAAALSTQFLVCIAGPDNGKRLALTHDELLVGRGATSNLLSDDPDVTGSHVAVRLRGTEVHVRALSMPLPFVDGHPVTEATLALGQQIRIGRSTWQFGAELSPGRGVYGFMNDLGDRLTHAAGLEKPGEWNPREMFSDVGKKRTDDDIEEYFTVGTSKTTPALAAIDARWPKPWIFIRSLIASLVLYAGFVAAWREFSNVYLIPAIIVIGSIAVPFSLVIFFFEVNVPRNVSLYQVIRLLLLGGLLSIVVSLFGFKVTDLSSWLGAASAGIIEETGKCLALLIVVNRMKFRWTLNGLLLGATVGAGFAVFESAGYALSALLDTNSALAMRDVIVDRGFLSIFGGHTLWTGLVGAALWRVRGEKPFERLMLLDPRFLRVFGMCVAMHMVWNTAALELPFYGKYLILGGVAWLLVFAFIQDGLKQVRGAQAAAA